MENSQMLVMFIFAGICFVGGFIAGYAVFEPKKKESNGEQN